MMVKKFLCTALLLTFAGGCSQQSADKQQKPAPTHEQQSADMQPAQIPSQDQPALSGSDDPASQHMASDEAEAGQTEEAPAIMEKSLGTSYALDAAAISFAAYDTKGNLRQSTEWVGKQAGVVVNIWGTWCGPCRMEIPALVELYETYKGKGIEIVSLAVNDPPDRVEQYAAKNNMNWVMLMGDEQSVRPFGTISGVPTTIFYNSRGVEIGRFVGARDHATFQRAFEELLKSS